MAASSSWKKVYFLSRVMNWITNISCMHILILMACGTLSAEYIELTLFFKFHAYYRKANKLTIFITGLFH